ncbi:MAG: 4-hydroxy-3-methylbut-2-enyl diphosphate reductase, partial [Clostridia bacterium]|nr:4-hydroxy-3-methylbut-2-enyl diphosphate reductase [Clostridia bacterium]
MKDENRRTRVVLAESAGFCFGVSRAVALSEQAAGEGVWALGHVIHNSDVVRSLEEKGLVVANREEEIPDGATAIIRAHGESPEVLQRLASRGISVVDTTCPCVSRIHNIVSNESRLGRRVIVVGMKNHPESRAISARAEGSVIVESEEELAALAENGFFDPEKTFSMVAQTTANRKIWKKCVNSLKNLCTNPKIFDTICNATQTRQNEADKLASEADIMIVIGDPMSSNSAKLRDICSAKCKTYFVGKWDELKNFVPEILGSKPKLICITAGASTPTGIIEEVNNNMTNETEIFEGEKVLDTTLAAEEKLEATSVVAEDDSAESDAETFAEMVDKSMKTLHTGQRVKGIVTRVTSGEIQMDLGTKHAGFIPADEFSDDPSVKSDDIAKVGDELEVFVTKVNDAEGYAML